MKLVHVITGLSTGGAEMMLLKLLSRLAGGGIEHAVVSLTGAGPIADRIAALGVPVTTLGMQGTASVPGGIRRLIALLRAERPDLVQTWMYHANLFGGVAAHRAGRRPVIWGIRQSDLDPRASKRSTILVAKLGGRLSRRLPARILYCSQAAREVHEAIGYDPGRGIVIPNGFDLEVFKPDALARAAVRREIGIDDATPLVGLPARFDAQKDHRGFLDAAALVRVARPEVRFALCGGGIDANNRELAGWIAERDLGAVCHLLGPRDDMPRVMAALDLVASSSSFGEGFPNVLGEAMAAGVPCVATDVGDSRAILDATGRTVPPRNAKALAAAMLDLLDLPARERQALGLAARARVAQHYGLDAVAARYAALYDDCLAGRNR